MAAHDAEVKLVHFPVFHFLIQNPQCFGIFSGHDNSAGVPVNSVDQGRGKGIFLLGVIFPLVIQVMADPSDEGVKVVMLVRMNDEARLLVQDHNIFVFVKEIEFIGSLEKILFPLFFLEKFLFQVQGYHIPFLQPGGNLATLAVNLDILFSDTFVKHGLRQVGIGFGEELVHTLAGVVFLDGYLPQGHREDSFQGWRLERWKLKRQAGRESTMPIPKAMATAILIVSKPLKRAWVLSLINR